MDNDFSKKYYKIGEVADLLDIPISTLRYWESQFTIIKPRRNDRGTRFYTPADIENIRMIHFLVKEKGLKLESAQEQIRTNRDGLDRRHEVISSLKEIRSRVQSLLSALE